MAISVQSRSGVMVGAGRPAATISATIDRACPVHTRTHVPDHRRVCRDGCGHPCPYRVSHSGHRSTGADGSRGSAPMVRNHRPASGPTGPTSGGTCGRTRVTVTGSTGRTGDAGGRTGPAGRTLRATMIGGGVRMIPHHGTTGPDRSSPVSASGSGSYGRTVGRGRAGRTGSAVSTRTHRLPHVPQNMTESGRSQRTDPTSQWMHPMGTVARSRRPAITGHPHRRSAHPAPRAAARR